MSILSPKAQAYIAELQQQNIILSDRACGLAVALADATSENTMLKAKLKEGKPDESKQ
jgi:hypothetical protein